MLKIELLLFFIISLVSCQNETKIEKKTSSMNIPKISSVEYGVTVDTPVPKRLDIYLSDISSTTLDSLIDRKYDEIQLNFEKDTISSYSFSVQKKEKAIRIRIFNAQFFETNDKDSINNILEKMTISFFSNSHDLININQRTDNARTDIIDIYEGF